MIVAEVYLPQFKRVANGLLVFPRLDHCQSNRSSHLQTPQARITVRLSFGKRLGVKRWIAEPWFAARQAAPQFVEFP